MDQFQIKSIDCVFELLERKGREIKRGLWSDSAYFKHFFKNSLLLTRVKGKVMNRLGRIVQLWVDKICSLRPRPFVCNLDTKMRINKKICRINNREMSCEEMKHKE